MEMFKMDQELLQATLRELDQAIYNHNRWYKELIRSIICRLPPDQHDLSDNAHQTCRFGQWYYSLSITEELRNHPTFISIEIEHVRMHKIAAKLLLVSSNNEVISPLDYDNFSNALERLLLNVNTLKHEIEETLYNRDPLTNVRNRVSMLSDLHKMHAMVKRNIQNVSIVMVDIDHFKNINDTYGHLVGDKVIKAVAEFLLEHTRPYDKVYRYGGEEFLVCMIDTDINTARVIMDRLREELSNLPILWIDSQKISITASFGISMLEADNRIEEAIEKADDALYVSKSSGRNLVNVWDSTMSREQQL